MSVTANQPIVQAVGDDLQFVPAAVKRIYEGTLVFIDASGYGTDVTGSGSNPFAGVSKYEVDNSGGAAGDLDIECYREGVFELQGTGFAQGDVGKDVYASDNYTVTLVPAGNTYIGRLVEFKSSTKVMVQLDVERLPRRKVNLAAATQTLTARQSGEKFVGAVDAVFTLPAASAATKGVWYEFETGALSSGTGLSISPAAADHIRGNGLTSVDDKDLINSGATDRLGDMVRLYCDGVDGWVIEAIIGTWAKEA